MAIALDVGRANEKRLKTTLAKYGVKNNFLVKNAKGVEKRIETWENNLGVDNPLKNKNVYDKVKKTCSRKYGVDNQFKRKDIIERINTREIIERKTRKIAEHSRVIKKGHKIEEWMGDFEASKLKTQMSISHVKAISDGKYPKLYTKIHRALHEGMIERNLWNNDWENEYPYILGALNCSIDIANSKKKIAIFADGDYWHNYPLGKRDDRQQSTYLKNKGWKVLRFWETDIKEDVNKCLDRIQEVL